MKVILLKDVNKIGKKFDIKEVNDGFAVNFLIPKRLAEQATPKKIAEIEEMKKGIQIEKKIQNDILNKNLAQIEGLELVIKSKANDIGHLFSSIHADKILDKMKKDYKIEIAPDCLLLEKPIKEIGEYMIGVSGGNKKVLFKLIIERE